MARCCRWCCRWLGIHRRPDAERGLVSARGPPPAAPLPPLDDLEGAAASAAADALHSEARTPSHCFRELRRGSHTLGGSAISEQGRTPEANDTSATPEQGRTPEASDAWDQGLREAEEDAAPAGPAGAPAECGRAATPQDRHRLNGYSAQRVPSFVFASSFRICLNCEVLKGYVSLEGQVPIN